MVYAASPSRTLLFIRGKFGGEFGLEPNFALPGLQRMSHKGYYILYKGEDGVLFLNSGVAVAGKITDLQAVVDNRDKNAETPPVELLNLVKTLPADHAWLVSLQAGVMAQKLPDEGNAGNFARLAKSLGRVTLHADLASAISMEAEGEYPNPELARQVQDTIRAGIGILRLRTPDSEAAMLKVYDGIRVEARENVIQVKIDAPFDFIDALMKLQRAPARCPSRAVASTLIHGQTPILFLFRRCSCPPADRFSSTRPGRRCFRGRPPGRYCGEGRGFLAQHPARLHGGPEHDQPEQRRCLAFSEDRQRHRETLPGD